jgi:hypothetical protein
MLKLHDYALRMRYNILRVSAQLQVTQINGLTIETSLSAFSQTRKATLFTSEDPQSVRTSIIFILICFDNPLPLTATCFGVLRKWCQIRRAIKQKLIWPRCI